MKTFKIIGMTLLGVMLCINFNSCSSEDEGNVPGQTTTQKRLTHMRIIPTTIYDNYTEDLTFIYDYKNRLSSILEIEPSSPYYINDTINNTYTWGANIIIEQEASGRYNDRITYNLNNNLIFNITLSDGGSWSFRYKSQQLLEYDGDTHYIWENGKIIKLYNTYIDSYDNTTDTTYMKEFTYYDQPCKGYLPIYAGILDISFCSISLTHPELMGVRIPYLPKQITSKRYSSDYEYIYEYSYTFDQDGYVESCTEVEKTKDLTANTIRGREITIYTFAWE